MEFSRNNDSLFNLLHKSKKEGCEVILRSSHPSCSVNYVQFVSSRHRNIFIVFKKFEKLQQITLIWFWFCIELQLLP